MNGRVLPFHPSEHAAVDARLPWYVNGTLEGEELERVEQHVKACEQCRREVDWLRELFAACAAMPWAQEADGAGVLPLADPASWSRQRPARIARGWRSSPPWVRGVLAAQLAAIAMLGALLMLDAGTQANYRTLGTANRSAEVRDAIAVMFDPAITEADLRAVLVRAGARIVDGPTATHAFVLQVPAAQLAQAVQVLRSEPMVRFAEPLGSGAR